MTMLRATWLISSSPAPCAFGCWLLGPFLPPGVVGRWMSIGMLSIVVLGPGWMLGPAEAAQGDQGGSAPGPDPERLVAEFHQDFRGGAFDYKTLRLVGGDAEQLVKVKREGLHIRMPAGLNNPAAVGVAPRFRVHGDFEITASFTIVKADNPSVATGSRLPSGSRPIPETAEAVTIERGIIPKEGERFTSTRVSGPPPPETRKYDVRRAPAESRSGKIRMARVGSLVITSFADGTQPFRVLRTVELGPEDLTLVRLGAETGVSDHSIEVRLEDLTIRAEALPGYAGTPPAPPRFPWALAAGALTGLALLGVAVWWLAAAKRSRTEAPPAIRPTRQEIKAYDNEKHQEGFQRPLGVARDRCRRRRDPVALSR